MTLAGPSDRGTAVVTGASSGIGIELCRELAWRGHNIALVARNARSMDAVAQELRQLGVRADVLPTDLAQPKARATLLNRIDALGLTPDILVNNAGFSTLGPVASSDPAREAAMIEVDVLAVADLCARFLPGMVARHRGAVLNVSSVAAFIPIAGQAAYCAGKSFVLTYTQGLAAELRGTGVSATVLCPGPVDTNFSATAGLTPEDIEGALPQYFWQTPRDVARVGIEALAEGRLVAVPGLANRAAVVLATHLPKALLTKALAKRHPGMRR